MRILIVTSKLDLQTGGGSNSDLDLKARTFQSLGHDVSVLTAFSGSNKIPRTPPYRIITENLRARGLLGIQWGILRSFFKYQQRADIYYFDGHNFLYGAGLYRRLGGRVPVVSFFNRELSSWPLPGTRASLKQRIRYALERYFLIPLCNVIDLHTFTSPAFCDMYKAFGLRFSREPLVVGDLFDPELVRRTYSLHKPGRHTTLLFSGRLVPMRGVDLLLTACSKLPDASNYRLVICGSGPDEPMLKTLAADLGLTSIVEFAGWLDRSEIFERLTRTDVFVIPKGNGATSVALLEAMTLGIPSVVPNDNALSWVAGAGAYTFTENDAQALAHAIERVANEPVLRAQLSKGAGERLEELDYKKTAARIVESMRALIAH